MPTQKWAHPAASEGSGWSAGLDCRAGDPPWPQNGVMRRLVCALLIAMLPACTAGDSRSAGGPVSPSPSAQATFSTSSSPSAVPHAVSLQALMNKTFRGDSFKAGRVLDRAGAYTRYHITFDSNGLTISGIMNVPAGAGPFPVLVLAHGYIDPDVYVNGQGLRREQDYLARRGYVVVHVDYRNHAQSEQDPTSDLTLRLGYTEDLINAVLAIQSSRLPYVDVTRIGLLGRSMGGGVIYNVLVVKPDLVKAAVVFAPVSSDVVDNFNRWIRRDGERRALADRIVAAYGSPEQNAEFWRNVSPRTFFDRIRVPLQIHQGTSDDTCPPAWADTTVEALRAHGKPVDLLSYPGEGHAFGAAWPRSMQRTVAFFDERLKNL